MKLRNKITLAVKDDIDPDEIVAVLEEEFDVEFHRKYKSREAIAQIHSYSVKRPDRKT